MRSIRTPENREAFLTAFAANGNVVQAAEAAGVSRRALYDWKAEDPEFAEAWEQAFADGVDALEAEALKRAFAGSDTLLIFLLKGNKAQKYKERVQSEISGPNGAPIAIDDATATERLAKLLGQLGGKLDSGEDLA